MAEAIPSMSMSIGESSDVLPDIYCNPCYESDQEVLEAVGFCQNCDDYLCKICFSSHHEVKQFKRHQLLDQTKLPRLKTKIKPQHVTMENCIYHQNENICSYCKPCDKLCCKICLTVDHHSCEVEKISTIAVYVKNSKQLKDLNHKMDILKKKYGDNHEKANQHMEDIQKYYAEALIDMKKIQEVNRLLAETEKQAELIKTEDVQTMETIVSTCEILGDQIDNIKSNLNKKENQNDNEALFIAMKRAESQMNSFENRLEKLSSDNTTRAYTFEPDNELHILLNKLEVLGKLSFSNTKTSTGKMLTTPLHVEDIDVKSSQLRCSILLPNQQILLTDCTDGMVKLLDIKQNKVVADHHLPSYAWDIAKVTQEEFAATCTDAQKIQFLKVTSKSISKFREISVNGECWGLAYNDRDQTLIVTYWNPTSKVEILSLSGSVIRSIERDENVAQLFGKPLYVALSRDKTMMYVSDETQNSVTLMSLYGKVIAVYKDDKLKQPEGICVNKSGIVYLLGLSSKTVHQLVPGSDKLKLLLSQKDGLNCPIAITYCNVEDKIYVGQNGSTTLKIYKMK